MQRKQNKTTDTVKRMRFTKREETGITLVALIITIIVLIILAAVTIFAFTESGLLQTASRGTQNYANAQEYEKQIMDKIDKKANEAVKNIQGGGNDTNPEEPIEPEKTSIAKLIGQSPKSTNYTVYDCYGNKIVVPANFIVKGNITGDIEYEYADDGSPSVQDGIVIEDSDGNQFVWIPVGNINNKDGTTTIITLGRYTFDSDGNETLEQNADDFRTERLILNNYKELETSPYNNITATNLEEFLNTTKENQGYYLGRYEASYRDGTRPYCKPSVGTPLSAQESTVKEEGLLWNHITQPKSATAAKVMYEENDYFVSDLPNSYAWDTAIVFIQKYSNEKKYSIKKYASNLTNTGSNNDKVCNIYDMAGNIIEWTTETSLSKPCTIRGGMYRTDVKTYTSFRSNSTYNNADQYTNYNFVGFRPLIYVLDN